MTKSLELVKHNFIEGSHGDVYHESTQYLSDEFLEELKLLKTMQDAKGRIGDYMHVCRIPRIIYNKWISEGFDPTNANEADIDAQMGRLREIVKRLKADNMDQFVLTDRTF